MISSQASAVIVLVDLDNTLVDRRTAFSTWASAFIGETNGSAANPAWLLKEDADGYGSRAELAQPFASASTSR